MEDKKHKFEHLGKAPYRFIDHREGDWTCDYCGTYIKNQFICESSDKKKFILGSSCVEKLGDEGLTKVVKGAIKEKNRLKNAEKRAEREEARRIAYIEQREKERKELKKKIKVYRQRVKKAIPKLKKLPHPNEYFASQGKTYYDYCIYFGWKDLDLHEIPDEVFEFRGKVLMLIERAGIKIFD